jgi:hypothetical protein
MTLRFPGAYAARRYRHREARSWGSSVLVRSAAWLASVLGVWTAIACVELVHTTSISLSRRFELAAAITGCRQGLAVSRALPTISVGQPYNGDGYNDPYGSTRSQSDPPQHPCNDDESR